MLVGLRKLVQDLSLTGAFQVLPTLGCTSALFNFLCIQKNYICSVWKVLKKGPRGHLISCPSNIFKNKILVIGEIQKTQRVIFLDVLGEGTNQAYFVQNTAGPEGPGQLGTWDLRCVEDAGVVRGLLGDIIVKGFWDLNQGPVRAGKDRREASGSSHRKKSQGHLVHGP